MKIISSIRKLVGGSVASQVVYLLFLPVISRFYGTEVVGLYGTVLAVLTISAIATSMKTELIIIEKKEAFAAGYYASWLMCFVSSIFVIPFVFFYIVVFLELSYSVALVALVAPILMAANQINIHLSIKHEMFSFIARMNIFRVVLCCCLQVVFYFPFGQSLLSLLLGYSVSYGVANFFFLHKSKDKVLGQSKGLKSTKDYLLDNKDTPFYAGSQALVNSFAQALPYMLLPLFANASFIGLFFYAEKVFRLPLMLVGQPVRQVFLWFCSESKDHSVILRALMSFSILGALVAFTIFLFFWHYGVEVFALVFGDDFSGAGDIVVWLSLWSVGAFLSFPALSYLRSIGGNKFILLCEVFFIPLKCAGLLVFGLLFGPLASVSAFAIISMAMGIVIFSKAVFLLKRKSVNEHKGEPA